METNILQSPAPVPQPTSFGQGPYFGLKMAIGAILLVGGLFMILAANKQLPNNENNYSHLGVVGQGLGIGCLSVGVIVLGVSLYQEHSRVKEVNEKIQTEQQENQRKAAIAADLENQKQQALKKEQAAAAEAQRKQEAHQAELHQQQLAAAERERLRQEYDARSSDFEAAKEDVLNNRHRTAAHPAAGNGYRSIYLLKHCKVVVKEEKPLTRHDSSRLAAEICHERGLTHLRVPKTELAQTQDGKTVQLEEMLPNHNSTLFKGMNHYYQNRQNYATAVTQFTTLLCHSDFDDVVGTSPNNPLYNLVEIGKGYTVPLRRFDPNYNWVVTEQSRHVLTPRFDNLLLFDDKIGLVDSEFLQRRVNPNPKHIDYALVRSIQLFPYHFDQILAVGESISGEKISVADLERYSAIRDASLKLYEIMCVTTPQFHETPKAADTHLPFGMTKERNAEIKEEMRKELLKLQRRGKIHLEHENRVGNIDQLTDQLLIKFDSYIGKNWRKALGNKELAERIEIGMQRFNISVLVNELIETKQLNYAFELFTGPKEVLIILQTLLSKMVGHEIAHYKPSQNGKKDVIIT